RHRYPGARIAADLLVPDSSLSLLRERLEDQSQSFRQSGPGDDLARQIKPFKTTTTANRETEDGSEILGLGRNCRARGGAGAARGGGDAETRRHARVHDPGRCAAELGCTT